MSEIVSEESSSNTSSPPPQATPAPTPAPTTTSSTDENRVIVMPVDASEHSDRAFQWYVKHIHKPNDLVLFVHVVEPMTSGSVSNKAAAVTDEFTRAMREATEEGKSLGHVFLQRAKEKHVKVKFLLHVGSKPGEHVVKTSKEHCAEMIIMGNRGIGAIRRTLLGSVSDYIMHHTDVACVVVPPIKVKKSKKNKLATSKTSISAEGSVD